MSTETSSWLPEVHISLLDMQHRTLNTIPVEVIWMKSISLWWRMTRHGFYRHMQSANMPITALLIAAQHSADGMGNGIRRCGEVF